MANETTFENVKLLDRVYSIGAGWGSVNQYNTIHDKVSLLQVSFDSGMTFWYTSKGFVASIVHGGAVNQTLFWDEVKIVAPVKPVVIPARDVLVLVKTCCNSTPLPRYSTGVLNPTGNLLCYEAGCTSKTHGSNFSNDGKITSWPLWEVAE